ncbi:AbrB/MazE/SpoVT family DNA-binding domain-containing protein [Paenibacillus sp. FSL R7-269]|uniref:AbrB/MazE/SpoVT family DNA-binding domain-containing protein n=1 Tax=unclassified Paenibacillus TaxID=185978 RepID=UPI0012EBD42C
MLPKHQVTLPKEVRERLELDIEGKVMFVETDNGILIKRLDQKLFEAIIKQD